MTPTQSADCEPRQATTIRVARLYRYPVKSLSPEPVARLEVTADGKVVGDRVFAFRFAHVQPDDPEQWLPKTKYASLMHIPELAALASTYDPATGTMTILGPHGDPLASGDPNDPSERTRFSETLSAWYETTESFQQRSRHRRQPHEFTLVGDGSDGRYHDTSQGGVTLHGSASIAALADALQLPVDAVDHDRFRSNIVVEGGQPWQEFDWRGRRIQIGDLTLKVNKPVKRCLATHVNPDLGVRDADVLNTLTRVIGMSEPQFAVSTTTSRRQAGTIRIGDVVRLLD